VDYNSTGDILAQMDRMSDAIYDRISSVQGLLGRFDVIHGHDWHPVQALNRIKSSYELPYILTIHATEWGRNGNSFGDGISRDISYREWLGGYESSHIIVTSKMMLDELKSIYSIPENKMSIIPNGIVKGKMKKPVEPRKVKANYGIDPIDPVVLFCGRMSYQKGPDLLVEAIPIVLDEFQDTKFIFAGEGAMLGECEHRAEELGAAESCKFLGYVTGAEKEALMNACDLVCIPSRNEPFGLIVLEAWDAGKPVVATEAVSIINNFKDGLLAYIQPQSLAWCINRLLNNPQERKKLADVGCDRIDAEFNWDVIADKTEEIYRRYSNRAGLVPKAG
jgi:glycosyltransferase involved in cell wall biosynthesis